MTVWIYAVDNGTFDKVATVENGDVVSGDGGFVSIAFDGEIPDDEADVAREFSDFPTVSTTDFDMEWEVEDDSMELSDGGSGNAIAGVSDETLSHAPDWDRPLLEMYRGVTDPDAPTDRALVSFAASDTPEFVLDRIREAVDDGAMFSDFDEIPGDRLMDLRSTFKDELGQDDFTLDSITESLMDFENDLSRDEAERIARTESSAVLNSARENGYQERGEEDGLFYWTGAEPGSDRQTEACEALIERTNPFHGGEPVPMDELRDLLSWAAEQDPDIPKTMVRPDSWVIHINERSTFAKAPPNWEQL